VNLSAIKVYLSPRMIAVMMLGVASGLPLALTTSTLSTWMMKSGVNKATIGALALVGLSYSFKFLWAPLVDQMRLPFLGAIFGRRRSWTLFSQVMLALSIFMMGKCDPHESVSLLSILAVCVAFWSATSDIVIDAFRIELLERSSYAAGSAVFVSGYRIGMVISGAGALFLASAFTWEVAYTVMSLCVGIGIVTVLFCPEPSSESLRLKTKRPFLEHLDHMVVQPLADFIKTKPQWLLILAFIILYKLGDAFLGNMLHPFYVEMGFSLEEIASVTKVFGLVATLLGGFVGGALVFRMGMMRSLLVCGILQILSNLVFIVFTYSGHSVPMLMAAISAENFTTGMGSVAFVAYLSSLCSINFTASQYAILSALATTGRTFFASSAGMLAEHASWSVFFLASGIIALPGIFALLWLMRKDRLHEHAVLGTAQSTTN